MNDKILEMNIEAERLQEERELAVLKKKIVVLALLAALVVSAVPIFALSYFIHYMVVLWWPTVTIWHPLVIAAIVTPLAAIVMLLSMPTVLVRVKRAELRHQVDDEQA